MLEMLQDSLLNLWYIALIALFFGGSIFVHELGHFLAARWRGLKIDRFSIGFGPKIFSWTRHGVEYRLSWIPLGGYVALPQLADMRGIEGDPGTETEKLPPIGYTDKMVVSVMGATFNVLFAFLLACILWVVKQPVSVASLSTTIGYVAPTVDARQPDGTTKRVPSPAALAGLQIGDKILRIDGHAINDWNDISTAVVTGRGWADDGRREAVFTVERSGQVQDIVLHPRQTGTEKLRQVGIAAESEAKVERIPPGSLAAQAGLQRGDYLVAIGGVPIRNIQTYFDLLSERGTETLELVVRRAGQPVSLTIPPRPHPKVVGLARDSLAHQLGVRNGDLLVALNGAPITTERQYRIADREQTAAPLTLMVQRGTETVTVTIPARPDGESIGIIPTHALGEDHTGDVVKMRVNPVERCVNVVKDSYHSLKTIIDPRTDIGLPLMSGPIEIVRVYHMVAKSGLLDVLWLTLMVNISLAVFNVLPIPVLDGGHMLFATITKLRGRPISAEFLMKTQATFMVLLLGMILYVSYFNARRWISSAAQDRAHAQIIWEGQELPPPSEP